MCKGGFLLVWHRSRCSLQYSGPPRPWSCRTLLGPFVIPGRAVCVSVNQSPVGHVSSISVACRSLEVFVHREGPIFDTFSDLLFSIWETLGSQCIITQTLWKHIFGEQYFQPSVDSLLQSPSTCLKESENSYRCTLTSQRVVFQHRRFEGWTEPKKYHYDRWVHWQGS